MPNSKLSACRHTIQDTCTCLEGGYPADRNLRNTTNVAKDYICTSLLRIKFHSSRFVTDKCEKRNHPDVPADGDFRCLTVQNVTSRVGQYVFPFGLQFTYHNKAPDHLSDRDKLSYLSTSVVAVAMSSRRFERERLNCLKGRENRRPTVKDLDIYSRGVCNTLTGGASAMNCTFFLRSRVRSRSHENKEEQSLPRGFMAILFPIITLLLFKFFCPGRSGGDANEIVRWLRWILTTQ